MTLSADERRTNQREALVAFLDRLADRHLALFEIRKKDYPCVLETTWEELRRNGFLLDESPLGAERFTLTCLGYVEALQVSGTSREGCFQEQLGRVCKALKVYAGNIRTGSVSIPFQGLVEKSGVPEAFARNAIDCELIERVFGQRGATWTDCKSKHFIKVPSDVGHKLTS